MILSDIDAIYYHRSPRTLPEQPEDPTRTEALFSWIEQHSRLVVGAVLAVTALLLVPAAFLQPDDQASTDPGGAVFEARELVDERLVSPIFAPFFIVEDGGGDLLRQAPLLELLRNEQALRDHPELGDKLFSFESANLGTSVSGVYTIADGVDRYLREQGVSGGLESATDDEVKLAVDALLRPSLGTHELGDTFSPQSTVERRLVLGQEIDYWVVPALGFVVLADNDALGGGGFTSAFGGAEATLDKEEYSRDVQAALRGDGDAYRLWGIAIDANLTSAEQGASAGPFITFTIIAVLVVVGIVLRSYWSVALVGGSLAILMVWLKGITNLLGFESSLIMDLSSRSR